MQVLPSSRGAFSPPPRGSPLQPASQRTTLASQVGSTTGLFGTGSLSAPHHGSTVDIPAFAVSASPIQPQTAGFAGVSSPSTPNVASIRAPIAAPTGPGTLVSFGGPVQRVGSAQMLPSSRQMSPPSSTRVTAQGSVFGTPQGSTRGLLSAGSTRVPVISGRNSRSESPGRPNFALTPSASTLNQLQPTSSSSTLQTRQSATAPSNVASATPVRTMSSMNAAQLAHSMSEMLRPHLSTTMSANELSVASRGPLVTSSSAHELSVQGSSHISRAARAKSPPPRFSREPAKLDEAMQRKYTEMRQEVIKVWTELRGQSVVVGEVAPSSSSKLAKHGSSSSSLGGAVELLSVVDLVTNKPPMLIRNERPGSPVQSPRSRHRNSLIEDEISVCGSIPGSYISADLRSRRSARNFKRGVSPRRGEAMKGFIGALPPKGTALQFPLWASGKDDINEQYSLMWDERVCYGGLNSLNRDALARNPMAARGIAPGCCSFIKAKTRNSRRACTVKVIPKGHIMYPKLFQSQISAYGTIDHQSIAKLYDVFEDSTYVYLVMEHLAGPSLMEKVLSDNFFNQKDASQAVKALLQAVAYLHQQKLLHQNLHPENLRFVTNFRAGPGSSDYEKGLKLLDFGLCLSGKQLASILNATGMDDKTAPPPLQAVGSSSSAGDRCIPPELRGHKATTHSEVARLAAGVASREFRRLSGNDAKHVHSILEASDMWSVGCIMHLLLTGRLPPERGPIQLPTSIRESGVALVTALLDPDPHSRPSAVEALRSDWFPYCALLKSGHPSVSAPIKAAGVTPQTPVSAEVRANLVRHHAQCQLRKLLLAVSSTLSLPCLSLEAWPSEPLDCIPEDRRSLASCILPVPPHVTDSVMTSALKIVFSMCRNTFDSLLRISGSTATNGSAAINEDFLMEILSQARDIVGNVDLQATFSRVRPTTTSVRGRAGVTLPEFADFIFRCICV